MIVVGGEALIDLVTADGEQLGAHAGGGPFNTARALSRLERPAGYLGRLSTDRFGERLAGLLAADGVRLDLAVRTEAPTTLALAEVAADGSATYRFYFEGTAAPELSDADAAAVDDTVEILHIGTLGLVFEPMAATLEALAARLAGRALVMVDPNCRPAVIADPAGYRARVRRVLGSADVVKVSEEDLAWLSPGVPAEDAAGAMLSQGPRVVLLTRGGDGATVLTADGETDVPGASGRRRRHDRRRRRVLRRLACLVVRARARARAARRPRAARRGDALRRPGRGGDLRARGGFAADARRAPCVGIAARSPRALMAGAPRYVTTRTQPIGVRLFIPG